MTASRTWNGLSQFWTQPLAPAPLALYRIALGAVVLLSLLASLAPYLDRYLGPDGLCPPDGVDDWLQRNGRFSLLRGPINLPLPQSLITPERDQAWRQWGEDLGAIRLLFGLWLASLFCMTLGLFTRPATVIAWVLTVSFQQRLSWLLNGGDWLFRTGLFYLMLTPSGAAWSLDNLLFRRAARPVPAWPIRLMQIHLCLIYLATGLVKIHDDWFRGVAVYWVLNDVALARWAYCQLPLPMFLCQLASWGTILFELCFWLLIWFPRLRPWVLLAGVGLHCGIWLATEVGWFSPITMCWYALFLSPVAAERVLNVLSGRGLFRRFAPSVTAGPGSGHGP